MGAHIKRLFPLGWALLLSQTPLQGQTRTAEDSATLQLACGRNDAAACRKLGMLYKGGGPVRADKVKAADLLRKSCDGGDNDGCRLLGLTLQLGDGVPQDFAGSIAAFRRACDAGQGASCEKLSHNYLYGWGVPQNAARAARYARLACKLDKQHCRSAEETGAPPVPAADAQSTRQSNSPSVLAQTIPAPPRSPRLVRLSAQGAAIVAFAEVGSIPPPGQPMPQAARIWSLAVYRNGANYGGKPAAAYWQLYDFECGEQIATLTALVAIDGQAKVVGTSAANARGQVKNGTPLSAIWALACGMARNSGPRLASAQAAIAASVPAINSQPRQQPKPQASLPRSPSMQDCKLDDALCAAVENDAQKALEKILRGE